MDTIKIIQEYYDTDPGSEWVRIENRPEFILTCRFLDRYIKPGQTVLDIGGGPGRYSLYLAQRGCKVTLLDLSGKNVEFALSKVKEQGLAITGLQGDACKADSQIDGHFDHVLLMGPLYHLLKEEDRIRAVEAATALLKEGGTLAVSFISMFAGIIFAMKDAPDIVHNEEEINFHKTYEAGLDFTGKAFTQAFFIQIKNVLPFMSKFPLKKLHLLGQEGISSPCEGNIMSQKEETIAAWMDICERNCEREELLSWSEHLLYIGQKQSLRLCFPGPEHKERALAYRQECFDFGETMINGDAGLDIAESYEAWLETITEDLSRDTDTMVPATEYFAMVGEELVGTIQLRHRLNEYLLAYGGHIGYEVAPSKRRQGYAKAMLSLALDKCRELKIEKALVTCDKVNLGSAATIKSCGGILEDERPQESGILLQRYWITL